MKTAAILCKLALVFCTPLYAADSKKTETIDPSGTWRWEHDEGGESIKDVLKLDLAGSRVTGTYQGRVGPIKIQNGKMDGRNLSFDFVVNYDGSEIGLTFKGSIKDDQVTGTVAMTVNGESEEFPWMAKRSVQTEDVIGKWKLNIETPDGNTLTPTLIITTKGETKELRGEYASSISNVDLNVSNFQLKKNRLHFTVSGEFAGNSLNAQYSVEPRGNRLTGKIEFEFNGESGELNVNGKREQKKP